jgi:hypothetical protein
MIAIMKYWQVTLDHKRTVTVAANCIEQVPSILDDADDLYFDEARDNVTCIKLLGTIQVPTDLMPEAEDTPF